MKDRKFVRFLADAQQLKNANEAMMYKRYPWFLNFYKKEDTNFFYPVYGVTIGNVVNNFMFPTGLISVQFILVNQFKVVIGYSGHADIFRSNQFVEDHHIVDSKKMLYAR